MNISRKNGAKNFFYAISIALIVILTLTFLYSGKTVGNQSVAAGYPSVSFNGQFKIADGPWQDYVAGKHIPANKGEVTLKGFFELFAPDTKESLGKAGPDTPIAFYFDHITGKISENGKDFYTFDTELDIAGEDMCGTMYIGYTYMGAPEFTMKLESAHKFGNAKAIDNFLDKLSVYGGTGFERDILASGSTQRSLGVIFILFAFMIIGTSIFSVLVRIKEVQRLWILGFAVLFAGIYFMFDSQGIMYQSEIIKLNTRTLGISMMLYILFTQAYIVHRLKTKTKFTGKILLLVSGITVCASMIAPMTSDIKFYDTWFVWAIAESVICLVMSGLIIQGFLSAENNEEVIYAFGMLPMIAFVIDFAATFFGWWQGGVVSGIVFTFVFAFAFVFIMKVIITGITAARRTKELETEKDALKTELVESRISTMISQIQPHFIYNTLGTIEQLCLSDPKSASKLVRNFSLYLRGNFSELTTARPIRFSQEMNHVKHYTDIEQVRFPDMTIRYDLRSVEFVLPALSVQPLVENAIKHGLMGLDEGGIVTISAFETDTHYVVEVKDDGVGFDSNAGYDETKHVGIKNIRGRIEAMCGGTLTVESTPKKGTVATIRIPKEVKADDSNNS